MLINSPVRHVKTVEFGLFFFVILIFAQKIADIYEYLQKVFLFNNSVFFYKIGLEILFAEKNYGTRPCYITAYF